MQRKCNVTAPTRKKSASILSTGMNQNNQKNKTNGPEFESEMDFYVPVGAILIELEGSKNPNYTIVMVGSED